MEAKLSALFEKRVEKVEQVMRMQREEMEKKMMKEMEKKMREVIDKQRVEMEKKTAEMEKEIVLYDLLLPELRATTLTSTLL